jgi:hypothetical protein
MVDGRRASPILAALAAAAVLLLVVMAAGRTGNVPLGPLSIGFHDYVKPLVWGSAAAVALLMIEWNRTPWRRAAIGGLALLGTLGLVNFATYAPPIVTDADIAVGELYTELATRCQLLVGPYSRFGWHHPGPLYFYLVAPFYALSGHAAAAMYGVALAINLAAVVTMAWVMARESEGPVTATVIAAVVVFAWRVPRLLASPWTAHVPIVPALAFLAIAAAVLNGRRWLLPLMFVFGSFAAQTNVGLVPVIFAVSAAVSALLILARRSGGPSPWPALNASAWVLALLWLVPIGEAVAHRGGNLAALWRFFVIDRGPGHPIAEAIAYGSYGLTGVFRPDLELPWGGHVALHAVPWNVVFALAEIVLLGIIARRDLAAGRRFEGRLALVAIAATTIGIWGLTRIREDILNHELFKLSAIGTLNLGILAAAAVRVISGTLGAWIARPAVRRLSYALLLLAVLAVGARDLHSLTAFERRQQERSAIVPAFNAVRDYAAAENVRRPLFRIGPDRWGDAAGVLLRLLQHGTQAAVMDSNVPMFTDAFAATGDEDALVTLADLELHRELREQPATSVLLTSFPLFVDAVRIAPGRRGGG